MSRLLYRSGRRPIWAASLLVTLVFAIVGCGDSSDSDSKATTTTGEVSNVSSLVPEAIKNKGTLSIAIDAQYPPVEFLDADGKTIIGMDAELMTALADVMGLKVSLRQVTFDSILPGVAGAQHDIGISAITDTTKREKAVDFVTYFSAGNSFYVKTRGGPTINKPSDLCGSSVGVIKGASQIEDIERQAKRCKDTNKPALKLMALDDQDAVSRALSRGRADVGVLDSPLAAYIVQQSKNQFKLTGTPYDAAPYGIAIAKGKGLAQPMLAALKVLMSNGRYNQILAKWGLADGAISDPVINGAID